MAKITIFKDSILFGSLINKNLDIKINQILNKEINSNKGVFLSNEGGFQTKNIQDKDVCQFLLKESVKLISENYNIFNTKFALLNLWINKNFKNNFNNVHNHPMADFSCVYYITVPENSGELIFFRGDKSNQMLGIQKVITNKDFVDRFVIQPLKNQLIIFPSHLLHMVKPNMNDEARISVSFNIKVVHG